MDYTQVWPIPVSIGLSNGTQTFEQRLLLGPSKTYLNLEIPLSLTRLGYFYPNADEKGYYRWQLEGFPAVKPEHLELREQLGYLDNLAALLQAGAVSPMEYFEHLAAFKTSRAPEVLLALTDRFSDFHFDLVDDTMQAGFARKLEAVLIPGLDAIGWDAQPDDGAQTHKARAALYDTIGMLSRNIGILERARQKVAAYQQSPEAIDPNLASVWIKLAALRGDRALLTNYQQHFEEESDPQTQQYYLNGLGYFQGESLALEALAYTLTDAIKPHEWGRIPSNLSGQPALQELVFNWYKTYYDTIRKKVPDQSLRWHVWLTVYRDSELFEKGRVFFLDPARTSQGIELEFEKAEDVLIQRLALYAPHRGALQAFFAQE
jgi:alanyl aminopeptidase